MTQPVVTAAGAVVWRHSPTRPGTVEVVVVHRPRYDDWSLPKGKSEPGEPLPLTAVREIAEETGSEVVLGRHLGTTRYRVGQRPKTVDYWAARALRGRFRPNEEVDRLDWVDVATARARVSYEYDAGVLDAFARSLPGRDTTTLLLVRHARAGSPRRHRAEDDARPLDRDGRAQADELARVLPAYGVGAVHAADRLRCEQTAAPLAARLGTRVVSEPLLSEEGYAADMAGGRARAQALLAQPRTVAVCSQGGVIPDLVAHLADRDGLPEPDLRTRKASTWVVTAEAGRVVALDHLAPPPR